MTSEKAVYNYDGRADNADNEGECISCQISRTAERL